MPKLTLYVPNVPYLLTLVAALVATVCACVAHYRLTRM